MDTDDADRNLVGVLFPGIVKNDERAIQCLGGLKSISEVNANNKKRLGLTFQPDNPFVKKAYSDGKKTAGVLLKVKVKKTTVNNEVKREVVSTTVMGRVTKMHRFDVCSDFQFLPIGIDANGGTQCILEKIIPSELDTPDFLTRHQDVAANITPSQLSRIDKPFAYRYADKKYFGVKQAEDDQVCARRSRQNPHLSMVRFNLIDDMPTEPDIFYVQRLETRLSLLPTAANDLELVKQQFEERPVWSFNALLYITKLRRTSLKVIAPALAYFVYDGPWRKLWVKYGYDPRKDPDARFYQILDFRIRRAAGLHAMVNKTERFEDHVSEGTVIFRPGVILSQRQVFYQYIDIKLPEVEQLLAVKPQPGYLCHPTRGWLPPNTDHVVRDHIFRYAKQMLLASYAADLKFEQGSSDDEQNNSDDDDTSMACFGAETSTANT